MLRRYLFITSALLIVSCAPQVGRRDAAPIAPVSDSDDESRPLAQIERPDMQFDTPAWKAIDKLIDEQKFEAARSELAQLRQLAEQQGNVSDWTRALIRDVQLGAELGAVETAVRTLREAKWPDDEFSKLVLELYYATTLTHYVEHYAYEISQRERVESKAAVDLKAWTRDQIVAEALRALQRVWHQRAALGGPATILGPYVELNNYPEGVRSTLRDVLSYHLVELLANTTFWRAEEANDLFRIDHAALLAGHANAANGQALKAVDATAEHPIVRATAVLLDLEAWHAQAGRNEAALEAQLERLRRLYAVFSSEREHKAQQAVLEQLLGRTRAVSWWSMGQYLLALWTRATEQADLARARTIALAGAEAYPSSTGAVECRRLIAEIEQPEFQLSGMLVDGAERRSLTVEHKNIKRLYFRAYSSDLIARVESARDYNLLPNGVELQTLLKGAPVAEWSEALPDVSDYASHRTFVTPPLKQRGFYTVFASSTPTFAEQSNRVEAAHLFITQLVIRHRTENDGSVEVRVFDGATGLPARAVELLFYEANWQTGHKRVATKTTDQDGLAKLAPGVFSAPRRNGPLAVIARTPDDIAPAFGNFWLNKFSQPDESNGAFLFTDRSVYRPNQTVQWKVLAYRGRNANYKNLTQQKLTVSLRDANGEEVKSAAVKTNEYGTASGRFEIPSGRMLGAWSIATNIGGSTALRVEEYKRPTFEVTLAPNREAARLNHPVALQGEGKYYFGLPVQSGQVKWKVERQERYPWWWWRWRPAERAAQVIAAGASTIDDKGRFDIKFTPEADPQAQKAVQFNYRVSVDLTDEGGETRSATRDFVLGQVSIDARLDYDTGFFSAGQPGQISLRRSNLDGDPRPGQGRYRIVALKQPAQAQLPADLPVPRDPNDKRARTPGDDLRPREIPGYDADALIATWDDGAELAAADISTGQDGAAQIALPKLSAGAYRIRYTSTDDFGAQLEVFRNFLVVDAATKLALPAVLKLEHASVQTGGIVRLLAASGLQNQTLWLEIYADGSLVERRELAPGAPALHEIPVGPAQRGGLAFKLVGLRDYQALEQTATVFVPWDDRQLALEFSTFRDQLRPGGRETFRVTVRGARDRTPLAAAELLAYMYDRSLDVFAPHAAPAPLSLYPYRGHASDAVWGIAQSSTLWVWQRDWQTLPSGAGLHGDRLIFPEWSGRMGIGYGRGSGGMRMRAMAPMPAQMASGSAMPMSAAPKEEMLEAKVARPVADAAASTVAEVTGPARTVRENFSETAFFMPNLLTDKSGNATLEFTVPDSVTSWNVWVHAITRDFRSGSVTRETRSVKDLLVRPYLPRFLREADDVALKVVVQNASKLPLSGQLTFEIFEPGTERSLAKEFGVKQSTLPFSVGAEGSTNLTLPITAPRRVGEVALRVIGKAGDLSDGEVRALPLLPSRLHLVQSKFATLRGDGSERVLSLADLAQQNDPTRQNEQLVVTVEAQLFMTVLKSLPFLLDYPYECSEQTLNRFLSAGIVSSVFSKYPTVKKMAADLVKQRSTLLEKFAAPDPNRVTQLEESPWLQESRGLPAFDDRLIKVLDPEVAARERDRALGRLQKMQTASGGFPWFPGGPPSPYMTLYLMIGFARASEFQVELPRPMIEKAWQYLAQHYHSAIAAAIQGGTAAPEFVTLLHFATTSFPDASWLGGAFTEGERSELLAYAFARWKQLSPLARSVLTLSLLREKRRPDAKLVFDSVLDAAKTTEDEGTFWNPEDRAWLWYNDRIETHAFALRTLLEINDKDPKLDGLVVWLLLNKKLNQWKSTRATAEVVYSLVKYLEQKSALSNREQVNVSIGHAPAQALVFEPEQYKGKSQIRIDGPQVTPDMAQIVVNKQGKGVAFASATWHYATDKLPEEGRGDLFSVKRSYFRREAMGNERKLVPLTNDTKVQPGDEIEVQLEITARAQAEYVHLRDPRPAGLEPAIAVSKYHYDLGLVYYEEIRDSGHNFFIEWLPAGEYTLKYRLRANLAGHFRVGPATLQSMYAPEFAAFSAGHQLQIE